MTDRDRAIGRCCLAWFLLLGGPFVSVGQTPILLEPGYTLTTLPAGIGAAGLACSPGGAWGDFVYVADSAAGTVERIDFDDNVTAFAGPFSFPVGLAFGPGPGNNFGSKLYVGDFGSSQVHSVTVAGSVSSFASFPGPGQLAFDSTGAYGTHLFAGSPVSSSTRTIDDAGGSNLFSSAPSEYLSFAPGGAWGDGLYVTDRVGSVNGPDCCFDNDGSGCSDADCQASVCGVDPSCCSDTWNQSCANLALDDGACPCVGYGPGIVRIDPAGAPSSFVDGFVTPQGFDWAEGAGWNGDMFAADLTDGVVRRLAPGGIRTDFARVDGASDVTFCNCSLYVASLDGGRWRISSDADDPDMDGTGEACDSCPGFFNPPGVTPVLGMDILASSTTEFSWPTAANVRYLRGPLALVSGYFVSFVGSVSGSTSFTDTTNPLQPGTGFYFLARPDCDDASWQTNLGAEPARDLSLP